MEVHPTTTEAETSGDGAPTFPLSDSERQQREQGAAWWAASTLLRWRWFILGLTFLAGVASIGITLAMPVWYAATARVLPPEPSGGDLSSLLGDVSPLASSLLGGGGAEGYTRYLAILNARTTRDAIIEEFDLMAAYELEGEPYARERTHEALSNNLSLYVDLQYDFLEITAFDQDPHQAARMANYIVDLLNERNEELALEGASAYRRYVEERYRGIELALDSARAEMQAFQERNGVVELPAMAQSLMESLAATRAEATRAEIEYRALLSELGPENPQVQAAQEALSAARGAEQRLLGGQEAVMPVPLRDLPAVGSEYARLYQELLVQQALLENARPLLEQARFEEERERTAVQVLDPAIVPERKARPKRSHIVIVATLSVFLLACLFALVWTSWRQNRAHLAARLRAS
ncbi:MAG TPA: lipopolysaccharide biosynthesis protein [Bacteroidetes bacterium]|nr:lipopolysaccharide biosynthesis protein [Bacteroidota bacterium]HIL56849.1 lipopolysaccharide biosynthesis protein [Rhodothermales bacterium]